MFSRLALNHVTDQTKMINRSLQGIEAQRCNKVVPNQLKHSLSSTMITCVGDVMLNQIAPTMEVCLNMVVGELERANRNCTEVKSLTESVLSLQNELCQLKTVLKGRTQPQREHPYVTEESIEQVDGRKRV